MALFAKVWKSYPEADRMGNSTYVNVVRSLHDTRPRTWAEDIARSEDPWNVPASNEFIIELTEQQYGLLNASHGMFHDGFINLPKVQQRVAWNGGARPPTELGSYADPADDASAWSANVNVPIPDDRFRLRVYDAHSGGTPTGNPLSAVELIEGVASGRKLYYMAVFESDDVQVGWNNVRQTDIGSRGFSFPFGSSHLAAEGEALDAGVTSFGVPTNDTGVAVLNSSGLYKLYGFVDGQEEPLAGFTVRIRGRDLLVR